MRVNIITIGLVMSLMGCEPMVHYQGKVIPSEDLQKINIGHHSKEDVHHLLGSPSFTSQAGTEKWYYNSKTTEAKAFFTPDMKEQEVVAITFDSNGIVQEVTMADMSKAQDISYVDRITPTHGRDTSFLKQIFGDFGRIARQDPKGSPP